MAISKKITPLLAGLLLTGFAAGAQAAPILDTYWGGNDLGYNQDVVGDVDEFQINSATITQSGANLIVQFDTTYSGSNVGTLQTNLGALFFGEIADLDYNGADLSAAHKNDTFNADTDRFSYVFDYNAVPGDLDGVVNVGAPASQNGGATLYSLLGNGDDVVRSNLLGNTTANGIRREQAVDIVDSYKTGDNPGEGNNILEGTWATAAGTVTFELVNFFSNMPAIYQSSFTLAWAMTCANDVFLTKVFIRNGVGEEVPLPAGAMLLLTALMGLGFLGRFKNKMLGVRA